VSASIILLLLLIGSTVLHLLSPRRRDAATVFFCAGTLLVYLCAIFLVSSARSRHSDPEYLYAMRFFLLQHLWFLFFRSVSLGERGLSFPLLAYTFASEAGCLFLTALALLFLTVTERADFEWHALPTLPFFGLPMLLFSLAGFGFSCVKTAQAMTARFQRVVLLPLLTAVIGVAAYGLSSAGGAAASRAISLMWTELPSTSHTFSTMMVAPGPELWFFAGAFTVVACVSEIAVGNRRMPRQKLQT